MKEGHFIQSTKSLQQSASAPAPSSGRPFPRFSLPTSSAWAAGFFFHTWAYTPASAVGCSRLLVIFSMAEHFEDAEIILTTAV